MMRRIRLLESIVEMARIIGDAEIESRALSLLRETRGEIEKPTEPPPERGFYSVPD